MTDSADRVRSLAHQAAEAHRRGDYATSASCYQSASCLTKKKLGHRALAGKLLHLSHLEKLLLVGTRDSKHLRRLIDNLQALAECYEDDRLADQCRPLTYCFTAIALCGVRRPKASDLAEARDLVQDTANPTHYMTAVANALTRLFLLASGNPQSTGWQAELERLSGDLESYLADLPMPREFAVVLEEVAGCAESLASATSASRAVFFEHIRSLGVMNGCSAAVVLVATACREHLLTLMQAHPDDDPLHVTPVLSDSRHEWGRTREVS